MKRSLPQRAPERGPQGGPERGPQREVGSGVRPAGLGRETSLRARVERIVELLRPAIQSDEGDLELVDVTDDGVVRIRLHGACVGCPSSDMTLRDGIERNLKAHIPEVRAVEQVGA